MHGYKRLNIFIAQETTEANNVRMSIQVDNLFPLRCRQTEGNLKATASDPNTWQRSHCCILQRSLIIYYAERLERMRKRDPGHQPVPLWLIQVWFLKSPFRLKEPQ
jgi:hypothetical protein